MYHNCYLIKCQWPLGWVFQKEGLKKACHRGCGTDYKGGRKESCCGNWGCSAVLCLTWSNHKDFRSKDNLGSKENGRPEVVKRWCQARKTQHRKAAFLSFLCIALLADSLDNCLGSEGLLLLPSPFDGWRHWRHEPLWLQKKKKKQLTSYFEIILIYRKLTKTGQKVPVYFSPSLASPKTPCPFWPHKPSGVKVHSLLGWECCGFSLR